MASGCAVYEQKRVLGEKKRRQFHAMKRTPFLQATALGARMRQGTFFFNFIGKFVL